MRKPPVSVLDIRYVGLWRGNLSGWLNASRPYMTGACSPWSLVCTPPYPRTWNVIRYSTLYIVDFAGVAAKTMVTTTIAAGAGAITTVLIGKFVTLHYYDSGAANNGLLAGLVGITAGCSTCEPEGAFIIGIVAGFVYTICSRLLVMFKVGRLEAKCRQYISSHTVE